MLHLWVIVDVSSFLHQFVVFVSRCPSGPLSRLGTDLLLFIAMEGAGRQWLPKEVVIGWLYNRALYHGAKPTRLWALGSLGCLVFLEDGAGTMGPERHHSTWLVLLCLASGLHT